MFKRSQPDKIQHKTDPSNYSLGAYLPKGSPRTVILLVYTVNDTPWSFCIRINVVLCKTHPQSHLINRETLVRQSLERKQKIIYCREHPAKIKKSATNPTRRAKLLKTVDPESQRTWNTPRSNPAKLWSALPGSRADSAAIHTEFSRNAPRVAITCYVDPSHS